MIVIFICLIVAIFELLNHPGELRNCHHPSSQSWWILHETNCASFPLTLAFSYSFAGRALAGDTLTPRVRTSTLPMTVVSYRELKERRWAYLCLARTKRQIPALWSIYLMQPTHGAKPSFVSQCFQAHQTGCGSSSTIHDHHSGQLFRKQRNLVTSSFDVDAEPHIEDDASA